MAVVGTAFVRLKVISDNLKKDISDSTKKAVKDSAPNLKASGEDAGKEVASGLADTVEKDTRTDIERIGDDIGNALGTAMGNSLGKSLSKRVSGAFQSTVQSGKSIFTRSKDMFDGLSDSWDNFSKRQKKNFEGFFKNALVSGISLAVVALPSILATAGAAVGALAGFAVTALTSIGPAAAGAAVAGVAAFSSLKLAIGLVTLALKTQTPQLEALTKRFQAVKDTVGTAVQADLLLGLNASLTMISRALPALRGNLVDFGGTLGDVAANMAYAFTAPQNLYRFNIVLQNTSTLVDGVGWGVGYFAQALLILLAHLGPVTSYLASGAHDLGQWVLMTMQGAEETGNLDRFITKVFDSAKAMGGVLVDFGLGLLNIFQAAFKASTGMPENLQKIAQNFAEWTSKPDNYWRMVGFFARMREMAGMLLRALAPIGPAIGNALNRSDVDKFQTAIDNVTSVMKSLGTVFEQIRNNSGDKLQVLFNNLVSVIGSLAQSGVIGVTAQALANLFAAISELLKIPGVGPILGFFASILAITKTISMMVTIFKPIIEIIMVFVEAIEWMVFAFGAAAVGVTAAVVLIVAGLVWFFGFTETGRHIVEVAFKAIWNAIKVAIDGIVFAFHWVVTELGVVWDYVKNAAQGIWKALVGAFNDVVSGVTNAWNTMTSVVTVAMQMVWATIVAVWNAVWGFIQPILQGIGDFFQKIFGWIVVIVQTALNILLTIWSYIFPVLALPVRIFYGVVILVFQQLVAFISWAMGLAFGVISDTWNAVVAFITPIVTAIWTTVSTGFQIIVGAITGALSTAWNYITMVWNIIWSFIQVIVGAIVGYIVDRWNIMVANVTAFLNAIWIVIQTVWNAIWGFLQPIIQAIVGFLTDRWNTAVNNIRYILQGIWVVIQTVWGQITGFLRSTMNMIGDIIGTGWDMVGDAGHAVLDGLKAGVNWIIGAINTVIDGINFAINLANALPGPDIPTVPKIPKLAKGGVVSPTGGGTLAMIAEAGRPERVEPLDPQGLSQRDRAIITELSGGGGAAGQTIKVYLGTREIEDIIDVVVEDKDTDLARRITTGTKVA